MTALSAGGRFKDSVLSVDAVRHAWMAIRGSQVERQYRRWVREFSDRLDSEGLKYDAADAFLKARQRTGTCGTPKRAGEVHSAIVTLTRNWGLGMVHELERLGPVTVFDWEQYGFSESDPGLCTGIIELNELLFSKLKAAHSLRPLDWILFTCNGKVVLKQTLRRIRGDLGVPTVNQWLDCKHTFMSGVRWQGQDIGVCDIAPDFDLFWTSAPSTCPWYAAVGARPIFLPEGFSPQLLPFRPKNEVFDVVFLGARYGPRSDYVSTLRRAGLTVKASGPGWAESVPMNGMADFFRSGRVCLGAGGVGYSERLTTLKGRDFEVPGSGATYLTTFNPDLAELFEIGTEVMCYQTIDEAVEVARRLVRDKERRALLAKCGYVRAMREHRWVHRFTTILRGMGIMAELPSQCAFMDHRKDPTSLAG